MEEEDLQISLDKLPIKRVEFIEENNVERFPSDVGYNEKTVSLIRRTDFGWAVELADLPAILLQQVATQVIWWLHEANCCKYIFSYLSCNVVSSFYNCTYLG
ncbi:unnamed protein product [Cuscuta epithymum]|uniref:Uncharacterized protein n=1 Tax=Cuscuta epithymum TaxID=186058 RepID=A0AAV0GLF8_9ASTE|nr:unnamed protein product [Cuscuta epithymum]